MRNRKFLIPLYLVLGLAVSGCEYFDAGGKSLLRGGSSITAVIENPVGRSELAAAYNTYGLTLVAANAYKDLPTCKIGQTGVAGSACKRRSTVIQMQKAEAKVNRAFEAGYKFVLDNPTLSAKSALAAVKAAVADFNAVLVSNGVR